MTDALALIVLAGGGYAVWRWLDRRTLPTDDLGVAITALARRRYRSTSPPSGAVRLVPRSSSHSNASSSNAPATLAAKMRTPRTTAAPRVRNTAGY